jgi:FlgD Ig-like domain
MRVRSGLLLHLWPCAVALALVAFARPAAAQCTITGPSQVCAGGIELCGPAYGVEFQWNGPGGPFPNSQCITVTQPGTYTLRFFDGDNGLWFGPCSHVVTAGSGGTVSTCSITGPTSGCVETGVNLCGPDGQAEYAWTGPDGFTASTACITAMASGSYSLVVRAAGAGCMSAPCVQTVSLTPCRIGGGDNCPWPPSAWSRQCRTRQPSLSDEQIAALAKCVDDRSDVFTWNDDGERFCRTVANRCDLRARARRHFAAVLASVCATDLDVVPRRSKPLGLDGATEVTFPDGRKMTVSAWMGDAETRLLQLENRSLRSGGVKDGYRAIIRDGWWIDHGHGMGPVCGVEPLKVALSTAVVSDEADDVVDPDFSLDEELADDPETGVRIDRLSPNPSPGSVFVSFSVVVETGDDVSIGVYDIAGRQLRELARGHHEPGSYMVRWDGRAEDGTNVPSGMYFVLGRVGGERTESRLMLVR